MPNSRCNSFEGCIYLSFGEIQAELDAYYEKQGSFLSLGDAVTRILERKAVHYHQHNNQLIPSLYHMDFDIFLLKIQDLRMEMDFRRILQMINNSTPSFPSDSIDVFMELSFHHVRKQFQRTATFQIDFIYRGTYCFEFLGEKLELKEGDIVFISPGAEYAISETSEDAFRVSFYTNYNTLSKSFLTIMERTDLLSSFLKEVLVSQGQPNYLIMSSGNVIALKYLLQSMILEQYRYDNYSPECSLSWLKIFFANVLRNYHDFHQYSDFGNRMDFGPILEYLIQNYRTLSLSEMAEHFNYSPSYLSSMIRRVTGKTYSQIVREYRLKEAQNYLDHTTKSIAEIAELCGYNDTDHFSKTFRASQGCSPQQYRKALRSKKAESPVQ